MQGQIPIGNAIGTKEDVLRESSPVSQQQECVRHAQGNSRSAVPARAVKSGKDREIRFIAIFSFAARDESELSFEEGDQLRRLAKIDKDWIKAQNLVNGKEGFAPRRFIQRLERKRDPKKKAKHADPDHSSNQTKPSRGKSKRRASGEKLEDHREDRHDNNPPSQRRGSGGKQRFVKAVRNFKAEGSDELSFEVGAIILLTSKSNEPWLEGELNGRVGKFPAAYVKRVREGIKDGKDYPSPHKQSSIDNPPVINMQYPRSSNGSIDHKGFSHKVPTADIADDTSGWEVKVDVTSDVLDLSGGYRQGINGKEYCDQVDDEIDDDDDVIEKIVGHRIKNGTKQCKVHWKGSDPSEDEWFAFDDLVEEWPELVQEYQLQLEKGENGGSYNFGT